MSNNDLYCSKCKTQHHPVECPMDNLDWLISILNVGIAKGTPYPQTTALVIEKAVNRMIIEEKIEVYNKVLADMQESPAKEYHKNILDTLECDLGVLSLQQELKENKMAYTKGNWSVYDPISSVRNAFTVLSDDEIFICEMFAQGEELNQAESEEARDNAQLIASAPQLLEACENLLAELIHQGNYNDQTIITMNEAKQAIKQAKGE